MSETCPYCQEWRNDCNTHLKRIKELEAINSSIVAKCNSYITDNSRLADQLAALRKRIDDAPVVAWCVAYDDPVSGRRIHSDPSMYEPQVTAHVLRCNGKITKVRLISKEDLQG